VYSNHDKNVKSEAIILIHGWGRNRGRMVSRARIYGKNGFTTILISVRDHGNSDREILGMNIIRFCEDLESAINWWGKPVIITGHSIGAGASLIVTARNPLVKALIAESFPYAFPYSLKYVYRPALKWFTPIMLPGLTIITLLRFRGHSKQEYSPLDAAPGISVPTFLIHGKNDEVLPYKYASKLQKRIKNSSLWVPEKTGHSDIELHPNYENKIMRFLEEVL
jgi:pimeloyl-ACP methyl ester carboxylesterase